MWGERCGCWGIKMNREWGPGNDSFLVDNGEPLKDSIQGRDLVRLVFVRHNFKNKAALH